MKKLISTVLCILLAGLFSAAYAQTTLNKSIVVGGVTRTYILYIPANYTGTSPVPLLFNFHGRFMTASQQMIICDFRPIADTAGFILVHPQGELFGGAYSWNVGGIGLTVGMTTDDIGFTKAMIDTISSHYTIDLQRVYSTGYSNGGYFSFELACHLGSRIAAIGSVCGSMTPETYAGCNPAHPTPVIQIHGTSDPVVNYYGTTWSVPVSTALTYWTTFNHANSSPVITTLPDLNAADGSTVEHDVYGNGNSCAAVEHYKVIGGNHTWPLIGGNPANQNVDFSASIAIWNFVSQYTINGKTGCVPTGINELKNDDITFNVYPNPSKGMITIQSPAENTEIIITNMPGHQITKSQSSGKTITLNIDHKGIYLVYIKTNQGISIKKVIIN